MDAMMYFTDDVHDVIEHDPESIRALDWTPDRLIWKPHTKRIFAFGQDVTALGQFDWAAE